LSQDIRYALRSLRFNLGFALIAITSLALGTGATTAIFQLFDAVRLRSLPVKTPDELVELRIDDMTHARGTWLRDSALTNPLWEQIRDRQSVFQGTAAWADEVLDISSNSEFRKADGLWVSGDFFNMLGVKPSLGRLFTRTDDHNACGFASGAVISYGFWQREFAGDPHVVGRNILVGKNGIEVIGVTPPNFFGLEVGRTFDLALPICSEKALHGINHRLDSGTTWWLTVVGRLKPGISMRSLTAILQRNSADIFKVTLPAGYPAESVKPYLAMKLYPVAAGQGLSHLREEYSRPLSLLLAIAGSVLLIACANLANLMLARASARQREIALRLAIGASRARVAQQVMIEGLLLAVAGAGTGLLFARVLAHSIVALLASSNGSAPFIEMPQDFRIFAFATALAVLTSLVFGAAPVLRAIGTDPGDSLRSASGGLSPGRERGSLRRALVAAQVAVSLVLLTGTLLFVESLRNLRNENAGFQQHGIVVADVTFSNQLAPDRAEAYRGEVLQRIRAIPFVEAAAETTIVPLTGGNWNNRLWMDGSDSGHARVSLRSMVGAGYFQTLRTQLLAGREFDQHDVGSYAKVAIVNEEFANEFIGTSNAIGRRFWVEATPYEPQTAFEIIGVVKNSKYRDLREPFQPVAFVPLSRAVLRSSGSRIMIRSTLGSGALISAVTKTLKETSPDLRSSFRIFDTWIQDSLLRERLMATLSTLFGILAIVLSAIGLYGVMAYTVILRKKELGIRIALGADRRAVIALIMRETVVILAAGLGVGTFLGLGVGRVSASLLFGLDWYSPSAMGLAWAVLIAVGVVAGLPAAWHASSTNPGVTLRQN
jgi:putative ABC transport system permease protein